MRILLCVCTQFFKPCELMELLLCDRGPIRQLVDRSLMVFVAKHLEEGAWL